MTAGADGLTVYVDGVEVASDPTRGTGTVDPSGSLYLGARQDLDAARYYGGSLDTAQVYNRALSSSEIADLNSQVNVATVTMTVSACVDSDSDGLLDCEEDANTDADDDPATNPGPDTDGDTLPNYLDADDDGDGTPTASENADPNADGDPRDALDSDKDGEPDYLDAPTVNSGGYVFDEQKVSSTQGSLTGPLDDSDYFGHSVEAIGDLDDDGVVDLAVGALYDDDGTAEAGGVHVLLMNADGTVKAEQKISETAGGFSGSLDTYDYFGDSVAALGDVDGDGVEDIAVGAHSDDDGGNQRGALYVLFLNRNGTVRAEQKISDTVGGLSTALDDGDNFGVSASGIGDLDGDGVPDLVVGANTDDDGGTNRGAVYVLFLNGDGTVKAEQKIADGSGGGPTLVDYDQFGISVASLGDVNGDGTGDIAIGAYFDDDGGLNRGALYVTFLNTDGTASGFQKISDTAGGFTETMVNNDHLATSLAGVGDLDGNGVPDLVAGAKYDDDGGPSRGAVYIINLTATGTVASSMKISSTDGSFTGPLDDNDDFGSSVTGIGDLDGDGTIGIAVGVPKDDDGGTDRGAVYVLDLAPPACLVDSDSDGLCDDEEDANTDADDDPATNPGPDTDGDTLPNYLDADDDGDGTPTASENADPNADGDPRDALDSDKDGQPDYLDAPALGPAVYVQNEQKISATAGGFTGPIDATNEYFGGSATPIGDLDGDGVNDVVIGASRDDDGAADAGAVYVLFLNTNGTVKTEQKISATAGGLSAALAANDGFGRSAGGIGDLDGDGLPDLIVGAPSDGATSTGAAYVLFLNADGTVKAEQKIAQGTGGLAATLDDSDLFGSDVSGIGDLDGDGLNDVIIGASNDDDGATDAGAVYILLLNADGTVKAEQKISATSGGLTGVPGAGDLFGGAATGIGDLDGDGFADVAVGASRSDGPTDSGSVTILLLNSDGTVKGEQRIADGTGGLTASLQTSDWFGTSVGGAGDINEDGVPDLMVGAITDDDGGNERGAVYLLFLNTDGTVKGEQKISSTSGGLVGPLDNNDRFGIDVAGIGDLDGDGSIDFVVGAFLDDDGNSGYGAAYVLFGGPSPVVTVNSTGDAVDATPGDDVCDTGGTNSDGDPECTLRAAIAEANASAVVDTIEFDIPAGDPGHNAGTWTFTPASLYPPLSVSTTIDATTQPGWVDDPIVALDGSGVSGQGIRLSGGSSTVRGLAVHGFSTDGLQITGGTGHTVAGNWFGLLLDGTTVDGNGDDGIEVNADGNTIGGPLPTDRNVSSGNVGEGIILFNADGNVVEGNYFGTDASGLLDRGNGDEGVDLNNALNNQITDNVISGNAGDGVQILAGSGSVLTGNLIGVGADGTTPLGNTGDGLTVNFDVSVGVRIGGTGAGDGNTIAHNGDEGISIFDNDTDDVAVLGNSFHSNTALGIDVDGDGITPNDAGDGDTGPNDELNFPVITGAGESGGTVTVDLDLDVPAGDYRIEAFTNPSGADGSGNGEGEVFQTGATITHTGSGVESFQLTYSGTGGDVVTLTATEDLGGGSYGSTSEFSTAFAVPSPIVTVNSTDGDDTDNNPGDGICDTGQLNSAGDPECTLYAAIAEAEASALIDTIHFDMPTTEAGYSAGVWTIAPTVSTMETIDTSMTIDGSTQPGFVANTNAAPATLNGTQVVVFDHSAVATVSIEVNGANVTLRGLVLRQSLRVLGDAFVLEGSYVKSSVTGGSGASSALQALTQFSTNAAIGGTDPAERNLLRGPIYLAAGAGGTVVEGNLIGIDLALSDVIGTGEAAKLRSSTVRLGGAGAGAANVLGGSFQNVDIDGTARATVLGNVMAAGEGVRHDRVQNIPDGLDPNDPLDADSGPNDLLNIRICWPRPTSAPPSTCRFCSTCRPVTTGSRSSPTHPAVPPVRPWSTPRRSPTPGPGSKHSP